MATKIIPPERTRHALPHKRFRILIALVLLTAAGTAAASPPRLKGLDAYVHKVMKRWDLPGVAIAIVKDGKVVLAKGYGVREIGKPGKVDADTLFKIGSNSKAFTAAAIGTLVSAGKLDWDARVENYVKDFRLKSPYVTEHITLRDLLTHRSGYCEQHIAQYSNASTIIQRLRYKKPKYGFRTHFCYYNLNYVLAARFIPSVTGSSWSSYVQQHLFAPLHMTRTDDTRSAFAAAGNIAGRHSLVDGKIRLIRGLWPHDARILGPAGWSISTSAKDMSHWLLMLLDKGRYAGKSVLQPAVVKAMETPQILIQDGVSGNRAISPESHYYAYGLGFFIQDYHHHKLVWHTGWVDGMVSGVFLVPDEKLGIVMLSNSDNSEPIGIPVYILQSYLDLPHRDLDRIAYGMVHQSMEHISAKEKILAKTRKPGTKAPRPLNAYAGRYRNDFYGKAKVSVVQKHLVLQLGNPELSGDLEHWHDNTFRLTWRYRPDNSVFAYGINYVTFDMDAYGKPVKLSLNDVSGGPPLHYERAPPGAQ